MKNTRTDSKEKVKRPKASQEKFSSRDFPHPYDNSNALCDTLLVPYI